MDDLLAGRERVERSAEALRRIKPDEAKALMLKAQGLSYKEIGATLSWSYANVMSTLAVFVALGGSSYAAVKISGRSIKNRSIPAKKLKRNSITGREVRESRLNARPRMPTVSMAFLPKISGSTARATRSQLPTSASSARLDPARRMEAQSWNAWCRHTCGPWWRLPTHGELRAALGAVTLAAGGELTSNVYPSSSPGRLDVLYVTDKWAASLSPPTPSPERSRFAASPTH